MKTPRMPGERPWWCPAWPSLRDFVTSVIAVGLLSYTGAVMSPLITSGSDDGLRHARDAWAILGTAVGAVLGFYFGAGAGERIAHQATQQAADAVEGKAQAQTIGVERLAALERQVLELARAAQENQEAVDRFLALLREGEESDDYDDDETVTPETRGTPE
jgi:hypothetical protein